MKFIVSAFLLFTFNFSLSQHNSKTRKYSLGFTFEINRLDIFNGVNLTYQRDKNKYSISSGYGIIKSVFQQRFFPKLGFQYTRMFSNENNTFQINPIFSSNFYQLKLTESKSTLLLWNESLLGYNISIGHKIKFLQQSQIGLLTENNFNSVTSKRTNYFTLAYLGTIGVVYEFP